MSPLAALFEHITTREPAKGAGSRSAVLEVDSVRAADRLVVLRARAKRRPLLVFLLLAGPGIMAMLGENDGPSMLSYATAGATFGIGFFIPFVMLTFAMSFVVQELTARLGIATGRGHARLILERFGPGWGRFAIFDLVAGNVLTLVTEFVAICAGARYFGVSAPVAAGLALVIAVTAFTVGRYRTWERLVIGLAVGNLIFIPTAFLARADPHAVVASIATWGPLPASGHFMTFITLIMATIGATVTPWMIFFQQSAVVDKGLRRADLGQARLDTALGAALAAVVAVCTIVAASPLFTHGVATDSFAGGADFASALRPYIGDAGASLFALGMVEAGLVALLTISTSSTYAVGELCGEGWSLNRRLTPQRMFDFTGIASAAIAAAIVLIPGAPLLAITITVNVVATLLMPPALVFLLLLANDRHVVGDLANTWYANAAAGTIVVGISLVGAAYGILTAFPQLLPR